MRICFVPGVGQHMRTKAVWQRTHVNNAGFMRVGCCKRRGRENVAEELRVTSICNVGACSLGGATDECLVGKAGGGA